MQPQFDWGLHGFLYYDGEGNYCRGETFVADHLAKQVTSYIEWIYQSYNQAKPYLPEGFDRDRRHPEWTRALLDQLGSPDRTTCNIAVTGSKGKGTHAILLAAVLERMGLSVGLFTSPHLVDFLERIRLNGQKISEKDFVRYAQRIRNAAETLQLPAHHYFGPVGYVAAIAAEFFRDHQTDVNIFELGRGARHDDVNQIVHQGALMTPVFLEHKMQLGPELRDVIWEKIGILTSDTRWWVLHPQPQESGQILETIRAELHLPEPIRAQMNQCQLVCRKDNIDEYRVTTSGPIFTIYGPTVLEAFRSNLVVVMEAAWQIWRMLRPFSEASLELHIEDLALPGRMQYLPNLSVPTLLDGAIHRENARRVLNYLDAIGQLGNKRRGAIVCLPDDKDGEGLLNELHEYLDWIIFCRAQNPHLQFSRHWVGVWQQMGKIGKETHSFASAWQMALDHLSVDEIWLLGTQSFLTDVFQYLKIDTGSIWNQPTKQKGDGKSLTAKE